ncbi:hypothetical protein [Listeria monocytogenes]|uniref:hypothetical protein n=1 Tax=Listeria monocytogenes TaxID=1639 RepID=UPI000FAB3D3F|nr:hypothetical protein [Listeria monocytogenes]EAC6221890.1 hypothetical protein [Listeria monocytogenes]EAD8166976.1 hypothetical protein [Listeria monocytogenes]EAG5472894.1 hypothetical protein [Listeria monocytogenes]EBF5163528.1 hypothetical protein [Listeria monocytogenes]EJS8552255.1 hypothetical protein [Listeria monocytogenes]
MITGNRNEVLGFKDGKVLNEKQLDNFREILTQEKFTKHFQEWSVWLEKDNLNFLKEFNEVFFTKNQVVMKP